MGLTWYNSNRLSTEGKNYYRKVVCLIIRLIWCHTEGKAAPSGQKKCFSTTTMHQLTRVPLQRTNYFIYATKYFLIHLIPQISLLPIIFCFLWVVTRSTSHTVGVTIWPFDIRNFIGILHKDDLGIWWTQVLVPKWRKSGSCESLSAVKYVYRRIKSSSGS